jgi:hypothetical protein
MSRRSILPGIGQFKVSSDVGVGAPLQTTAFDMSNAVVQFTVTSGRFRLEGTVDGLSYITIANNISSSSEFNFSRSNRHRHYWRSLRIRTLAAGTMTAVLGVHEFTGN